MKKPIFEIKKRFRSFIPMPSYDRKSIFGNSPFTKPKMKPVYRNENSYLWLLKPTGFNRGRGIQIFTTLEQLENYIREYYEGVVEKSLKQDKKEEEENKDNLNTKEQNIANNTKETNNNNSNNMNSEGKSPKNNNNSNENAEETKKNEENATKNEGNPNVKTEKQEILSLNIKSIGETPIHNTKKPITKQKENKPPVDPNDYIRMSLQNMPTVIKSRTFVIQKYIERPLLINSRKFDIRVWALASHTLDIYFFKQGYLRTSSEEFTVGNVDNYFIHLTNNAVQKFSNNYGQFENGNQLSFQWFQKYMEENYPQFDFRTNFINRIKELIYMSLSSVRKKLNTTERRNCFEIFGYDFIVDETLHVWLIEVNTNPCLEESSPLLAMLIPRMLGNLISFFFFS